MNAFHERTSPPIGDPNIPDAHQMMALHRRDAEDSVYIVYKAW